MEGEEPCTWYKLFMRLRVFDSLAGLFRLQTKMKSLHRLQGSTGSFFGTDRIERSERPAKLSRLLRVYIRPDESLVPSIIAQSHYYVWPTHLGSKYCTSKALRSSGTTTANPSNFVSSHAPPVPGPPHPGKPLKKRCCKRRDGFLTLV